MQLRRPTLEDKETIMEMMSEFKNSGSAHDGGFWDPDSFDYDSWIEMNQNFELGIGVPDHFVPSIQYVFFDDMNKSLGFLSLRLRLNEALFESGGHIGYSVRPSQRGNGYAKQVLATGLQYAKNKNICPVLVTCKEENSASRSVILANGGHFEDCRQGIERYWINIKE